MAIKVKEKGDVVQCILKLLLLFSRVVAFQIQTSFVIIDWVVKRESRYVPES